MSAQWLKILIFAVALGGFLLLSGLGLLDFLKSPVLAATQPFVKAVAFPFVKTINFFKSITFLKSRLNEYREVNDKYLQLQAEMAKLEVVKTENQSLRELLNLKESLNFTTITSSLVSRDPSGTKSAAILDKGESHGIMAGNAVLDKNGNLLGVINKAYSHSSEMAMVTSGDIKIDVEIAGKDSLGILTGSHGLGLNLEMVSQGVDIQKGDKVVTSGLTGEIPRGILVGEVEERLSDESNLFQKLTVLPTGETKDFREVLIVINF